MSKADPIFSSFCDFLPFTFLVNNWSVFISPSGPCLIVLGKKEKKKPTTEKHICRTDFYIRIKIHIDRKRMYFDTDEKSSINLW